MDRNACIYEDFSACRHVRRSDDVIFVDTEIGDDDDLLAEVTMSLGLYVGDVATRPSGRRCGTADLVDLHAGD